MDPAPNPPAPAPAHPPAPAAPALSPLTAQHLEQLAQARGREKILRRTIALAKFNGWTLALVAGLSALGAVLDLVTGLVMAAGLGAVAYFELRGAAQLRRLQVGAPRLLGFNQLALGGLLVVYAVWQLIASLHGPSPYAQALAAEPALASMLGPIEQLTRQVSVALYSGLIAFAVLCQGCTAWYYFSRTRHLRAYLEQTPAWIVQMQRSGTRVGQD